MSKWCILPDPVFIILIRFHQLIFTPFSKNYLIFAIFHNPNSFSFILAKLSIIHIFLWIPLESKPIFTSFIQDVVLPSAEIDLSREVPDNCKVACDNYNAVRVFFEADLFSWNLKVLEDLLGFMEELLLALFSWKEWVREYFRYFDRNILLLSLWRKTNFFHSRQRGSIRNFLNNLSRGFSDNLLSFFLSIDNIHLWLILVIGYLLLLRCFSYIFWFLPYFFQWEQGRLLILLLDWKLLLFVLWKDRIAKICLSLSGQWF